MSTGDIEAQAQESALVEALRQERAARHAAEALDRRASEQTAAMWTGLRKYALPAYLAREARRCAPRGRSIPLGTLPADVEFDAPRWVHEVRVGGEERVAMAADPPTRVGWRLDLDHKPSAVCGWFALRPEAWELFDHPLELVVRLADRAGLPDLEHVVPIHPRVRAIDRRWVPWRLELPATSGARLELETRSPTGEVDRAWLLIGEPALDLVGADRRPSRQRRRRSTRAAAPAVAVLMPVHDPPLELLDRTLASVAAQTSSAWELCIVDDGSQRAEVRERLTRAAAEDDRVKLVRHEEAQGISAATNAALALTQATYVATLDHDDVLATDAIERVATCLGGDPLIDILYTDNDLVAADDLTFSAALKPAWSPDLLRACMYTLHLGVYRRTLVESIGGWRSAFDGAQDHDLVLRLSEVADRIVHLPAVCAHWRAHAGSAALGELAKPTAYDRGRDAIAAHLERVGSAGTVERLPWPGRYRVRYPRTEPATVLLPPGTPAATVAAWKRAVRDTDEVVLVETGPPTLAPTRLVLHVDVPVAPESADAIDTLLGYVESGAAVCGGTVLDGVGRVLAGGVAFPDGLPVTVHVGADGHSPERHPSLTMASNRLAVRGVVAARAGTMAGVLGTPSRMMARMADIALGGGRVVWEPAACFTADADAAAMLSTTRTADLLACDRGAARDLFWNPQLHRALGDESYDLALHDRYAT